MPRVKKLIGALIVLLVVIGGASYDAASHKRIAILDDCKPNADWGPLGGCVLEEGDVTRAEFDALLFSPLSFPSIIGHPSWRNEPGHLLVNSGRTVRVTNEGGRNHTFTEVENFGGGRVPQLNGTLLPAPECAPANAPVVPPGAGQNLTGLDIGLHRFQCCIHPWMRTTIRVADDDDDDPD